MQENYQEIRRNNICLIILFALAAYVRYLYIKGTPVMDPEALGRMFCVKIWADSPSIIPSYGLVFGPLYFYFYGTLLKLFGSFFSAGLIITYVNISISLLGVFVFYQIVLENFNRRCAFFAAMSALFFPLHIKYSVLATAEMLYILLLMLALFCFTKAIKIESKRLLYYSAFFVNLAFLCRFEAMVFGIVFLICLLFSKRMALSAVTYTILLSVCVFFWGSVCYFSSGNLLEFFSAGTQTINKTMFMDGVLGWGKVLIDILPRGFVFLGCLGIIFSVISRRNYLYVLLFVSMLFLFIIKGVAVSETRYMLIPAMLLIFFMAVFIGNYFRLVQNNFVFFSVIALLGYSLFFAVKADMRLYKKANRPVPGMINVISFLRNNVDKDKTVLLEDVGGTDQALAFYGRIDPKRLKFVPFYYKGDRQFLDKVRFTEMIINETPDYIVHCAVKTQSRMGEAYFFGSQVVIEGIVYNRIAVSGIFMIYEIKKDLL